MKIFFLFIKLIFQVLIEIIFPYFCVNCGKINTLLCSKCYEEIEFCSFPFNNTNQLKYLDEVIVVTKYKGVIKKLINQFKYRSIIDIGKVIGRLIYRCSNVPDCEIIVPVPIHKTKRGIRGFNQSEEIVKELSKLTGIPSCKLLDKSKNTRSQMSIPNKQERQKNIIDSFQINFKAFHQFQNSSLTAIIVDDVITTGSTLDECAKVLKSHGIKKAIGLVLAQR